MLNILIMRVSAIGDVIHTLPCVFLLKQLLPTARISWVVQKKAASLLLNQPFLEHVYVLPDNFLYPKNIGTTLHVMKELRSVRWDGIIDFQGLTKTSMLLAFLSGKKYGFDKKNARWPLSTWFTHKQTTPEFSNIVQKNLALAAHAAYDLSPHSTCPAVQTLQPAFQLAIQKNDAETVQKWITLEQITAFIALCPNTTWESKHWPLEHWVAVARELTKDPLRPLVLVGSTFGQAAKDLATELTKQSIPFHTMPAWNLAMTGYALTYARLVIAPDTGLLHLCDYLGIKTMGIFGPTSKNQHGPFLDGDNVKQALQIPCPHFYKKEHGDGSVNCMARFTPTDMLAHIHKALAHK
jgi:lipopolysaccharide heptosyltransferase I